MITVKITKKDGTVVAQFKSPDESELLAAILESKEATVGLYSQIRVVARNTYRAMETPPESVTTADVVEYLGGVKKSQDIEVIELTLNNLATAPNGIDFNKVMAAIKESPLKVACVKMTKNPQVWPKREAKAEVAMIPEVPTKKGKK